MDAVRTADQPAPLSHAEVRTIISGVLLAMFLAALDQTIVATALPTIGRELHNVTDLPWVVTAYLLAATAATPLYGKFSDIHGRRVTMLFGIATFMVGSLICALAPNMLVLIVARGLQGLGGGGLISLAQTVVADVAAPRERGRYQAYFAAVFTSSSLAGPVLGGVIAEHLHWSVIFWINLPLGLLAYVITSRTLRRLPRNDHWHRLDMLGAASDHGGERHADARAELGRRALRMDVAAAAFIVRRVARPLGLLRRAPADGGGAAHSAERSQERRRARRYDLLMLRDGHAYRDDRIHAALLRGRHGADGRPIGPRAHSAQRQRRARSDACRKAARACRALQEAAARRPVDRDRRLHRAGLAGGLHIAFRPRRDACADQHRDGNVAPGYDGCRAERRGAPRARDDDRRDRVLPPTRRRADGGALRGGRPRPRMRATASLCGRRFKLAQARSRPGRFSAMFLVAAAGYALAFLFFLGMEERPLRGRAGPAE